jgi:hypothetical protein
MKTEIIGPNFSCLFAIYVIYLQQINCFYFLFAVEISFLPCMEQVFRIRDIFTDPDLWIRTSGSRIRIMLFFQWLPKCQQNKNFPPSSFAYYLLHLHQSSNLKSQKCGNQGFCYFFNLYKLVRIRIREAQEFLDSDTEHCMGRGVSLLCCLLNNE